MGFTSNLVDHEGLIEYSAGDDPKKTLIAAIQNCLGKKAKAIKVQLPADIEVTHSISEILLKLQTVLSKRGQAVVLMAPEAIQGADLLVSLREAGCLLEFLKTEAEAEAPAEAVPTEEPRLPEETAPVTQELSKKEKQKATQERAEQLIGDLKEENKLNEFDLDFQKILKEADFGAWPDLSNSFDSVLEKLEIELRWKEKLVVEKNMFESRMKAINKVVLADPASKEQVNEIAEAEQEALELKKQIPDLRKTYIQKRDLVKEEGDRAAQFYKKFDADNQVKFNKFEKEASKLNAEYEKLKEQLIEPEPEPEPQS